MCLFAQKGTLRGNVTDAVTGEPIMFGSVYIHQIGNGMMTDLDGNYSIDLQPGNYDIKFTYIGYKDTVWNDVTLKSDDTITINCVMFPSSVVLDDIVVKAKHNKSTTFALAAIKSKSANVMDGISASTFKAIGDGNAASAVGRVTGVSVQEGKYVYVRGLGDRYSKTTLNRMEIPGLDPDRNTIQIDIFPTQVIDNILVSKSYTADLPADFTGGLIDIATKDFPNRKYMTFSFGVSYNPRMHFNQSFLSYKGGKTDFLGFDDGSRVLPVKPTERIPFLSEAIANPAVDGKRYTGILESFNSTLAAQRQKSSMDFNLNFSFGNQWTKGHRNLGYNVGLTYQNKTEFFQRAVFNRYGKTADPKVYDLELRSETLGDYGVRDALLAGYAGLTLKTNASKHTLNFLHIRNGESKAGLFDVVSNNQGTAFTAVQHNLEYSQRSISNAHIQGVYEMDDNRWKLEWNLSPSLAKITDPDIRYTRLRNNNGIWTINTESGIPERSWRFLTEYNYTAMTAATLDYSASKMPGKVMFGGQYSFKDRSYEINNFQIFTNKIELDGNPDHIFLPENLWSDENKGGVTFAPNFLPVNTNKYRSDMSNAAGFVSNELTIRQLKIIIGLRSEYFTQRYTGLNQDRKVFDRQKVLEGIDFFPSANLVWSPVEKQKIRLSYSRTIARTSFKEASYATLSDPISGFTFVGGFFHDIDDVTKKIIGDGHLVNTDIDNFDLRWEIFGQGSDYLSVSSFYKLFKNPIEMVQYVQAPNNFQPRNVGNGMVGGAELEYIKDLSFLGNMMTGLSFRSNFMYAFSSIQMAESEYSSRIAYAREGEKIQRSRQMAGQAPYLINAVLSYKHPIHKAELTLAYNVYGRTLQYVGIADKPDIYSRPFHSLNFNANMPVLRDKKATIGVRLTNILHSTRGYVYQSFNTGDHYFSLTRPGMSISFRFSYNL